MLAAVLQFPRRVLLLPLALLLSSVVIFVLFYVVPPGGPATMLIGSRANPEQAERLREELGLDDPLFTQYFNWLGRLFRGDLGDSFVTREPVTEVLGERALNSLILLGSASALAFAVALLASLVGALLHHVGGVFGSILRGLGRLLLFPLASAPALSLAVILLFIFAIQFREWNLEGLPVGGILPPDAPDTLANRLPYLVLPSVALASLAAVLTGQAVARASTLKTSRKGFLRWLAGFFLVLGSLLGQIGGLLSALVVVELVFAYPGFGRVTFDTAVRGDFPVVMGALVVFTLLVAAGRLAAELFRWLARLIGGDPLPEQPAPEHQPKAARIIWVVLALLLLAAPLLLGGSGALVSQDRVVETDPGARMSEPSAEHPLGTDELGRDMLARLRRGAANDLLAALGAAAICTVLALLGGALVGALRGHGAWWSESLADLLLLPADALALIPILPLLVAFRLAIGFRDSPEWMFIVLAAGLGVMLAPRAVRFYQEVWAAAPREKRWLVRLAPGLGALILGSVYGGLLWVSAAGFMGFGLQPPAPGLGEMIGRSRNFLMVSSQAALWPAAALWLCLFALFMATDALVGFSLTKEAFARLNE
jgi:ABC-type dipeptide/oligopeptide/nickel transport system permease component/ABC-type dipeptide/oligopeptide/nickel transport system permease subunit